MAWQYTSATIQGDKANPRPGDTVTVVLTDPANPDPNTGQPDIASLTWTFDGEMTRAEFVAMVQQEVQFHIEDLNKHADQEDVTEDYRPVLSPPEGPQPQAPQSPTRRRARKKRRVRARRQPSP